MAGGPDRIQDAFRAEGLIRHRIIIDKEHAQQAHQGAGYRIVEIFHGGRDGFPGHFMQDQRHGGQRGELEAAVDGQHVAGTADSDHGAQGQEQKAEEDLGPLFHLHILKGVKDDTGIQDQDRQQEKPANPVQGKIYRGILREPQDSDRRRKPHGGQRQKICQEHDGRVAAVPGSVIGSGQG